jgi:GNAT superfamily N-acetyltransferase
VIRAARPEDCARVVELVVELATYEREPDAVKMTAASVHDSLFGPHPRVFCQVAEVDGEVVGLAIWYVTFSTWEAVHGIWLEDLYVRPAARGLGLGRSLLTNLFAIAANQGWARVEWAVLDWNEPAQAFYRSLGAEPQADWSIWRRLVTSTEHHLPGTAREDPTSTARDEEKN